jgi:hypothetical protein
MFRPQGLVTLSTVYSLRAFVGFFSRQQRSWDLPFGAFHSRKVSGTFPSGSTHLPFSLPLLPSQATGRPDRPRFLGFNPYESPWRLDAGLAHQPLAAPLGFALLGFTGKNLGRDFSRPPLTRFNEHVRGRIRRRLRVSIGSCLVQATRRGKPPRLAQTTLVGFWHQSNPVIQLVCRPGYVFTLRCVAHCCRPPTLSGRLTTLPELTGPAEVPSLRHRSSLAQPFGFV